MSPTPSSVVPPLFSIAPYPTPIVADVGPIGHSAPIAIIIAWVLTAFLPIPLIILIISIRYFPNGILDLLAQFPLPRTKRDIKFSDASGTSSSTPSSRTLTVSSRTSQTLPVPGPGPSTPPQDGISNRGVLTPRTPQNSLATNHEGLEELSKTSISPLSGTPPNESAMDGSHDVGTLPSCFVSPKRLAFVDPPSNPTTPSKKTYIQLSNSSSPRKPSVVNLPATPRTIERRRLRHRIVMSAILLLLIFGMYVLEGFTIVVAQGFAHVRIMSQSNGEGGLGDGKEDERWVIPWAVYIFLQGGMVLSCTWMVWAMRRELVRFDRKWTDEKGKSVEKGDDLIPQSKQSPINKRKEEEAERFLPDKDDPQDDGQNPFEGEVLKALQQKEEEEPEWQTMGYHPTFDSIPSPTSPRAVSEGDSTPISRLFSHYERLTATLNGEGSSRDFSAPGPSSLTKHPASSLPISFLPRKEGPWWAERTHAGTELQRRSLRAEEYKADPETGGPSTSDDQMILLQDDLLGPKTAEERLNSWALEEEQHGLDESRDKGKGKEKAVEDEGVEMRDMEMTPQVPREFITGIDLNKDYRFTDGLAYPLLPLPARGKDKKAVIPPVTPMLGGSSSSGTHTSASPFTLPLPPRLLPPTSPAPARFPKVPISPPYSGTFSPSSSRTSSFGSFATPPPPPSHLPPTPTTPSYVYRPSTFLFPASPSRASTPYRPSPLSPKRAAARGAMGLDMPPVKDARSQVRVSGPLAFAAPVAAHHPLRSPYSPVPASVQQQQQQQQQERRSSPSPPPLASPLSSPFPIFPKAPKSPKSPKMQQPAHRIPSGGNRPASPRKTIFRQLSKGGGKRHSYRRLGGLGVSELGTVREVVTAGEGDADE